MYWNVHTREERISGGGNKKFSIVWFVIEWLIDWTIGTLLDDPSAFPSNSIRHFVSIRSRRPTNTINQFAAEFVAIAKRGRVGRYRCIAECSLLRNLVARFGRGFRFVSDDPRRVEGARFIPLVPCVYRWTRVWLDRKGLNIFFGGPPLPNVWIGASSVGDSFIEVSIRNFMVVKGSRNPWNETSSVNFSGWKKWRWYRYIFVYPISIFHSWTHCLKMTSFVTNF